MRYQGALLACRCFLCKSSRYVCSCLLPQDASILKRGKEKVQSIYVATFVLEVLSAGTILRQCWRGNLWSMQELVKWEGYWGARMVKVWQEMLRPKRKRRGRGGGGGGRMV